MLDRLIQFLLPSENTFFQYLDQISKNLVEGATRFEQIKDAKGRPRFAEIAEQIKAIEHEGDELARVMHDALDKTFVTPLDREDLHALTNALEGTLDTLNGTANRFALFGIEEPTPAMRRLVTLICESITELAKAVSHLKDMSRLDLIQLGVAQVRRLENDADFVYRSALAEMFAPGSKLEAAVLVRDKDLLESLEIAADTCHHAMTTIRAVVVKNL